jgi:putative ABC transport system permease protein
MSWIDATRARMRLLFARRAAESRMDEEFRFHMQMETEKNIRAGMSPDAARRRAAIAFGGVEEHKEEMREGRGLASLGGWSLDLKLGARMLAKYPGLAIVGGLGMALATAIGAGAYAVFNVYFNPELPLHEGDRVVAIINWDPRVRRDDNRVLHDFVIWRQELRSIVDLGAFRTVRRNLIGASGQGEPVTVAEMTASGFRVARVPPLLGRTLLDADERPGALPVVVIGHDVWESRFGRDSAVLGRTIRLGRVTHTIVGVMPPGFGFPISHSYWVSLRVEPAAPEPGTGPEVHVFGRLAPGATRDQARAELTVIGRRLASERSATRAQLQPRVVPYTDIFGEGEGEGDPWELVIIQVMLTLLLVLVCLNVAVLVYARTVARTGEIAVRTALGATRGRVVTQLFAEAFVLSVLAALLGLALVAIGLRWFDRVVAFVSETGRAPFWIDPGLSVGTVLYALALAVLAAVIVGVFPALRATGAQLRVAMVGLGAGAKAQLGRTWTFFIVAQVAIAVAALPPTLLWLTDLIEQATQKPRFAAHEVLGARFLIEDESNASSNAARTGAERAGRVRATQAELVARLTAEPGVVGVTIATGMPGGERINYVQVDGTETSVQVRAGQVDANYFDLFGVRLAAGRSFGSGDAALAADDRPVVVSRSFVSEILGGGAALGRRIRYRTDRDSTRPWLDIVGVVEDFPPGYKNPQETAARVYHLAAPDEMLGGVLMIRLRGHTPHAFIPTLQQVVTSVDPMLQLIRVRPLDMMYADRGRMMALLALVITILAASVLLLSAAGIHALMSFTINQRRREIGIRAALGADARRILTGVLSQASWQLALGVAIGLGVSLVLERWSEGEMMGGSPLVYVPGIAAFMTAVGLLAAAGPARRGLRVQPTEALRAEV